MFFDAERHNKLPNWGVPKDQQIWIQPWSFLLEQDLLVLRGWDNTADRRTIGWYHFLAKWKDYLIVNSEGMAELRVCRVLLTNVDVERWLDGKASHHLEAWVVAWKIVELRLKRSPVSSWWHPACNIRLARLLLQGKETDEVWSSPLTRF